jgi:hypothetical protein
MNMTSSAPDLVAPDLVAPHLVAPDLVAPHLVAPGLVAPDLAAPDLAARKTLNQPRFRHNVNTGIKKYIPPDIPQVDRMVPEKEELLYDKVVKRWKLVKIPN